MARRAGVSPMTVSRTLNQPEAVSPATRELVLAAVRELGYVPNAVARSLTRGRTDLAALVLPDIQNPFFTTLARGAEDAGLRHGYRLVLCNTDEQAERERDHLRALHSRQVDGVILASAGDSHAATLVERGIPVVLVDREVPGVETDSVLIDHYDGARQLVRHLVQGGYRRLALVGGRPGISSIEARLAGCRDALAEAGLPLEVEPGRLDRASGEAAAARLCDEGRLPEAIVAANNMVAVGVVVELRRRGLRVPHDVALACFGELELASLLDPFLTVVRDPAYEAGRLAMQMLCERLAGFGGPPRRSLLPVELVVRRSTLRPAAPPA